MRAVKIRMVQCVSQPFRVSLELQFCVISMVIVYYPYYAPNFSPRFYQQGPYPPWMAQPAYSSRGWSGSRQWTTMGDGGLSELGLTGFNYGQPQLIETALTVCPTCYPAPISYPYPSTMIQAATDFGQLSIPYRWMSPSFYPAALPMSYSQPQWSQPAPMFRYY
jgi:hypothetical protein